MCTSERHRNLTKDKTQERRDEMQEQNAIIAPRDVEKIIAVGTEVRQLGWGHSYTEGLWYSEMGTQLPSHEECGQGSHCDCEGKRSWKFWRVFEVLLRL